MKNIYQSIIKSWRTSIVALLPIALTAIEFFGVEINTEMQLAILKISLVIIALASSDASLLRRLTEDITKNPPFCDHKHAAFPVVAIALFSSASFLATPSQAQQTYPQVTIRIDRYKIVGNDTSTDISASSGYPHKDICWQSASGNGSLRAVRLSRKSPYRLRDTIRSVVHFVRSDGTLTDSLPSGECGALYNVSGEKFTLYTKFIGADSALITFTRQTGYYGFSPVNSSTCLTCSTTLNLVNNNTWNATSSGLRINSLYLNGISGTIGPATQASGVIVTASKFPLKVFGGFLSAENMRVDSAGIPHLSSDVVGEVTITSGQDSLVMELTPSQSIDVSSGDQYFVHLTPSSNIDVDFWVRRTSTRWALCLQPPATTDINFIWTFVKKLN